MTSKPFFTFSRFLVAVASLCFAIALLLAAGVFTGQPSEQDGGLVALALSFLSP